ncbi:NUDIX domain-containing protein [Streptomyces sp. NPDC005132]|uniref:NUDIX domain-containing protein n=1 Tax=Streptomyces sp. NPDC005132 TaxID=3154294 RepID=UPI0033B4A0D3
MLLSRRAGEVYAAGLWHLPPGHLDGPHEDIVTALLREAREETSVVIDPADVRAAVTVHHRAPGGSSHTGFFGVGRLVVLVFVQCIHGHHRSRTSRTPSELPREHLRTPPDGRADRWKACGPTTVRRSAGPPWIRTSLTLVGGSAFSVYVGGCGQHP